jgi:acyl carrier protein
VTTSAERAVTARATFVRETTAWINRRLVPAGVTIDERTPLFEDGLIDSLRILLLIAWTEKMIGRRIADEHIRMDRFRDVRTIADTFVEE